MSYNPNNQPGSYRFTAYQPRQVTSQPWVTQPNQQPYPAEYNNQGIV